MRTARLWMAPSRRIRPSGCLITPSQAALDVILFSGWAGGNTTAGKSKNQQNPQKVVGVSLFFVYLVAYILILQNFLYFRNCGNIFCADCSENSTPLPSEHLYDPVRVCTSCFSKLSRHAFNSAASTPEEEVQDALLVAAMPLANAQHRVHHHHHPHLHHAPPPPHEQCKTHADRSAATTTNPRQITASSN